MNKDLNLEDQQSLSEAKKKRKEYRKRLQQLLQQLCARLDQHPGARKIRWSLDIDPQELG